MMHLKNKLTTLLRWSEKYTKTDMVYLAKSSFWLQANSFFISVASFLLYVVFGHVLSKEVYGTYQYLLSFGAIVSAFTLTGMSTAVVRAVARGYEGTFLQSVRVQLLWGILPLLGSWAFGGYYFLQGNTTLGWGLMLIGVFIPFNTTFNTYSSYLTAKKDFKRSFTYSLFVNIPYYVAVALVSLSLSAAIALLAANLISQALGYLVAHYKTIATYHPNNLKDPEAMGYGRHLSVINALGAAVAQIDNVLVFHFLGAAQLALYSFITAIPDRLGIFKILGSAAFPKYVTKTHEEIRSSLTRKVLLSIGVALLVVIVYGIFANSFFTLFFPKYLDAVPLSQLYALIVVTTFSPLFTTPLTAHGHVRLIYTYKIVTPILQLSFVLIGILWWGLTGLVLARIGGAFVASLLSIGFFLRSKNHSKVSE